MQVRTGQPETTPSENQGDLRRDVIEGLRELEAAAASLRASLLQLEERVQRTRHHLEGGGPAADLPRVAHVMEQRARVNACLADMQHVRHRSQRSLFMLAVEEGFSLAEIARAWGISRQLVSRMTKEEPGQGSPA